MAETEESAMEDENYSSSFISDADEEPKKPRRKGGTRIPLFGFGLGLKSQTPTRQRESAKHAASKLLEASSILFYHLKT